MTELLVQAADIIALTMGITTALVIFVGLPVGLIIEAFDHS